MTLSIRTRTLTTTLALVATLTALSAAPALGDPPNRPRFLSPAQATLTHEPEILGGLAPTTGHYDVSTGPVQVSEAGSPGFAWGAAGIGAAVALGAILLAVGGAIAVRRRITPAH
jgi:hypothetical protein